MQFIDTHCHIHDSEFSKKYAQSVEDIIKNAKNVGINKYICVGTSAVSSKQAVEFSNKYSGAYASLALHPHEISDIGAEKCNTEFLKLEPLIKAGNKKIIAIGECGLDYFYHPQTDVQQAQQVLFRSHIDLALKYDLPLIFHIRDAFDDFFKILDEYNLKGLKVKGVVHSFSAHMPQLVGCLDRGLYIGLNGIMTFTRDQLQLDAAKAVPLDKLLLETDAPFLTPKPFRGMMCELKHVVNTAEFLSNLRNESLNKISEFTSTNAINLFSL